MELRERKRGRKRMRERVKYIKERKSPVSCLRNRCKRHSHTHTHTHTHTKWGKDSKLTIHLVSSCCLMLLKLGLQVLLGAQEAGLSGGRCGQLRPLLLQLFQ